MKLHPVLALIAVFVFSASIAAQQPKPDAPKPPQAPVSLVTPNVHPDNSVTFQFLAPNAQEVLRQVLWAVEEGALQRFGAAMAVNIALKKIREGAWSRPNRMPPNWMRALPKSVAQPEPCSFA